MSDSPPNSVVLENTSAEFDQALIELTNQLLNFSLASVSQNITNLSDNVASTSNLVNKESNLINITKMTTRPKIEVKPLELVPEFDGSPCRLFRFISMATEVLNTYWDPTPDNANCPQNMYVFNSIISKLTGRAEEVISISGAQTWGDIKNTLITNFGDQRDENSLLSDLISLRQKPNEDCVQFYYRIIATLNTLHNYISLHECDINIRKSKLDTYNNQALRTLLVGLRDPQQSMIRSLQPDNLPEALKYMIEDNNIRYMSRQSNYQKPKPNSNNFQKSNFQQNSNHYVKQPFVPHNMGAQYNVPTNSQFPQGPIQIQQKQNFTPRKFPTNQQVFGKQTNVWKPNKNSNSQQYKPTPMSTTSHQVTQNQRNFKPNYYQSNPGPSNNFSGELFNLDPDEHFTENSNQNNVTDENNYEYSNYYTDNNEYSDSCDAENDSFQNFQADPNLETDP